MTKLTTERLETIATWREKYGNGANVMIPAEEAELMARRILAYDQAAKNPVASCWSKGGILQRDQFIRYDVSSFPDGEIKLFAAPVLPKQPELVDLSQQVEILNRILNWILKELPVPTQKASAMAIRLSSVIDIISDLSFQHPAQLVSKPYKLPVGYFSYGTEHSFKWHQTAKQATDDAEAMIDDYRGDACDGWSEETDNVCWGVILQQAGKVNERPRTDDDNDNIAPHIDTVCDYALLPAQESE